LKIKTSDKNSINNFLKLNPDRLYINGKKFNSFMDWKDYDFFEMFLVNLFQDKKTIVQIQKDTLNGIASIDIHYNKKIIVENGGITYD
jgi:hypothetical protein